MSLIRNIYRTLVPEKIRQNIINAKNKRKDDLIKHEILNYYKNHPSTNPEINQALSYLTNNPLTVFPYPFFNDYIKKGIRVEKNEKGMPYVMHGTRRLYFKKSWTEQHIIDAYRFLLAEQDLNSPHCYLTSDYTIKSGGVVVDVGAAEGIFAINEIERIKHIYLIETDVEWIEALKETYWSWLDKVTIINKFVSDRNDEDNLTLDSYFKDIKIDFLKIDVDGAEAQLLRGAEKTIEKNVDCLAICTYHKQDDNKDFSELLNKQGYSLKNSDGYMLFYFDSNFLPPYFRKGLIRAQKK